MLQQSLLALHIAASGRALVSPNPDQQQGQQPNEQKPKRTEPGLAHHGVDGPNTSGLDHLGIQRRDRLALGQVGDEVVSGKLSHGHAGFDRGAGNMRGENHVLEL